MEIEDMQQTLELLGNIKDFFFNIEERAKEILQEIINKYLEYATISTMAGLDIRQICVIPRKYEMPKE